MTINELSSIFATKPRLDAINSLLSERKTRRIRLRGLEGSAPALLFASLKKGKQPFLVIADDFDTAGYIYHDICQIHGDEKVKIFPSGYKRDIKYGQTDAPSQILRTEVVNSWSKKQTGWVITCPEALAEKVPCQDKLDSSTINLKSSDRIMMSALVKNLREQGYCETYHVFEPGQFSKRGSILDV